MVELLLPAGNIECLRVAVNNGADAVYLGLYRFNARQSAGNFDENNLHSAIEYAHKKNVKVYVTLNTLVKNNELEEFFELINLAYQAKADAVIIQDPCFIPLIKRFFPNLNIHLSTQATITNTDSIPEGVKRTILARELGYDEIKEISQEHETEVFIHGALCFSYSGQCLFSSIAGGRSGNRGMCAQPCRRIYNNKYSLSTMDLCMLEKIPEIIEAGVKSLKIEGRMRSPLYVQTTARIYRKAIDSYEKGNFSFSKKDVSDLRLVFNREFTTGFAYNESVIDTRQPMNRGLYIGNFRDGKVKLKEELKVGDGIGIWKDKIRGYEVKTILKDGKEVKEAFEGDEIELETKEKDKTAVYKTSSVDMELNLGDEIEVKEFEVKNVNIKFDFEEKQVNDSFRIFVKAYSREEALDADDAGASVIYYDLFKKDCLRVKKKVKAKFFVYTPRILSNKELKEVVDKINEIKPDGVLVGNRGLLKHLKDYELHLDYSFNVFNDVDLDCYDALPIISPELNFNEISELKNKEFIVLVHGDIVLMNAKEKLKAPELIDEDERHFKVIKGYNSIQILNAVQLGLFNNVKKYLKEGIKYFYIDTNRNLGNIIDTYQKIFSFRFDDRTLRKGYTKGHFDRGVY